MATSAALDDLGMVSRGSTDVHWFATGEATGHLDAAVIDAAMPAIERVVTTLPGLVDSMVAVLHRGDPPRVVLGVWQSGGLTLSGVTRATGEVGEWVGSGPPPQLTVADLEAISIQRYARRRSALAAFSDAWRRRDIDALLSVMSPEPTYRGSTGPLPGTSFFGVDEVRAGLSKMLGGDPVPRLACDPEPVAPQAWYVADRAITFWSLPFTNADGTVTEVPGVDLLTFDADDRIQLKDAYRKAFP